MKVSTKRFLRLSTGVSDYGMFSLLKTAAKVSQSTSQLYGMMIRCAHAHPGFEPPMDPLAVDR